MDLEIFSAILLKLQIVDYVSLFERSLNHDLSLILVLFLAFS
jgi:hypothetical protein